MSAAAADTEAWESSGGGSSGESYGSGGGARCDGAVDAEKVFDRMARRRRRREQEGSGASRRGMAGMVGGDQLEFSVSPRRLLFFNRVLFPQPPTSVPKSSMSRARLLCDAIPTSSAFSPLGPAAGSKRTQPPPPFSLALVPIYPVSSRSPIAFRLEPRVLSDDLKRRCVFLDPVPWYLVSGRWPPVARVAVCPKLLRPWSPSTLRPHCPFCFSVTSYSSNLMQIDFAFCIHGRANISSNLNDKYDHLSDDDGYITPEDDYIKLEDDYISDEDEFDSRRSFLHRVQNDDETGGQRIKKRKGWSRPTRKSQPEHEVVQVQHYRIYYFQID